MKPLAASLALGLALLAAPAFAVEGGKLGTLERGTYVCEMPGDAAVARGVPVPGAGFQITSSSTYRTDAGRGNYLRTGDRVAMTSGPRKGERYSVESERFLRKLDETGTQTGLRCVQLGIAGNTVPNPSAPCRNAKRKDSGQASEDANDDAARLALDCGSAADLAGS